MKDHMLRKGRTLQEMRPLNIKTQVNLHAEGSALIQVGHTHVLCTASVEEQVPPWMKHQGKGWITAEYSLLPRSTHSRTKRERERISGRTHEIQRLISRSLRACVDLAQLGERSILIDCDVLQADGGTRTASITGACLALAFAIGKLIHQNKVKPSVWLGSVAAVSLGVKQGEILVDLDYHEDSSCEVDMNFVFTKTDRFIELQGTGENGSFDVLQLQQMTTLAINTLHQIRAVQEKIFQQSPLGHLFSF